MTKQGWIALHRKIQEHHLWDDKPFSKGQAWIDLLLLANHEDKKFLLGNELMTVEQGMVVTSIEKLKTRWGWSNTKVTNFLKLLENDEMIVRKSDTKKTVLTIVNYSNYSSFEKTKTMRKRCENDTKTMRKHTNNNDNNVNNDNNINKENIKESKIGSYNAILSNVKDDSLRELYLEYIKMRKMIKAPMTDRALTMLISKVNKLEPNSIDNQKKMLETAIINNWKNVYPLKEDKKKSEKANYAAYDLEAYERMLNRNDEVVMVDDDPELKAEAEKLKKELAEKY